MSVSAGRYQLLTRIRSSDGRVGCPLCDRIHRTSYVVSTMCVDCLTSNCSTVRIVTHLSPLGSRRASLPLGLPGPYRPYARLDRVSPLVVAAHPSHPDDEITRRDFLRVSVGPVRMQEAAPFFQGVDRHPQAGKLDVLRRFSRTSFRRSGNRR